MSRGIIIGLIAVSMVLVSQPVFATKRTIDRRGTGTQPIKYQRPPAGGPGVLQTDRTGRPIKVLQADTNIRPRQPIRYVPRSPQPVNRVTDGTTKIPPKHVPRSPQPLNRVTDGATKLPVKYPPRKFPKVKGPAVDVPADQPTDNYKYVPRDHVPIVPPTKDIKVEVPKPPPQNVVSPVTDGTQKLPVNPVVQPPQVSDIKPQPPVKQNFGFRENPNAYKPKPMPKRFQGGFWNRETKK